MPVYQFLLTSVLIKNPIQMYQETSRSNQTHHQKKKLHAPIPQTETLREARCSSSVLLLFRCPHGNNNLAADARALGACWGIICTSSWTPSNTVHWMTGGRHRSAKCRDLCVTPDGDEFQHSHLEIKEYLFNSFAPSEAS